MTARSLPEWIGSSADAKIPPRVRVRVFDRFGGVCQLSGRKIMPGDAWQCDHIVALVNGGAHREANLQPVLAAPHRAKTAKDVAEKATVARKRAKHIGVASPKAKIQSRGFPPAERQSRARAPLSKTLPPRRPIYEEAP